MSRPKVILFDNGETLIHFAGLDWSDLFRQGARAGHCSLRARGIALPPEYQFVESLLWRGRKGRLRNWLNRRELDVADLCAMAVGELEGRVGKDAWREFIMQIYQPLAQASRLDDQALPVLNRLRTDGFRVALLSNTFVPGYAIDEHLRRLGLLDLFEQRFYSEAVGVRKPSLTLFRHAARAMGVRAEEIWHVGNDLVADVLGARRAGMTAVMRLRPGERVHWWWLIKPHRVIHELTDLLSLLGIDK